MSNDHKKRLEASLEWEGFSETKVKSDGNCQFSSLADQLFNSPSFHEKVRERIVQQLKSSKKRSKNVPKDFSEYVKNMSKNGEWGDDVTLQAAADAFGVKILVITSYKEYSPMEIFPKSGKFKRVIYLSYLAGVHFNSIHLKGETDTASMELQGKNKKKVENDKEKNENKIDKDENKNENDKDKDKNENENKNEGENENENEDDNDKKKKKKDKNKKKKKK